MIVGKQEKQTIEGINKVHHMNWMDNSIPDKSIQLIIADPPYFQVKGEFDFVWSSFDDYLKDVEKWCIECKRVLAENGTLFWWGMDRKIAYSQIIFDKHFNLLSACVWEKPNVQNEWETRRTFPERGQERFLMYSNEVDQTGLEMIVLDVNNFKTLRSYFKKLYNFINCTKKEILTKVGQSSDHCFRFGSTQWSLPTKETYNKLINIFNINKFREFKEYEELRKEYEELRKEYEELRRPFDNFLKLTDVLRFSKKPNKYKHPTQKPEKLTKALIKTCSRKNDTVLVPFAGSGTECAMSARTGRNFIGFDINANYVEMSNKRCSQIFKTPELF